MAPFTSVRYNHLTHNRILGHPHDHERRMYDLERHGFDRARVIRWLASNFVGGGFILTIGRYLGPGRHAGPDLPPLPRQARKKSIDLIAIAVAQIRRDNARGAARP